MGAGTKRKKKDQPLIRLPGDIQNNFNGNYGDANTATNMCVISFDVKITPPDFTIDGITVQIIKNEINYIVTIHSKQVGTLTIKQTNMVQKCEEIGIRYKGTVVTEKEVTYARFFRVA